MYTLFMGTRTPTHNGKRSYGQKRRLQGVTDLLEGAHYYSSGTKVAVLSPN